MKAAKFKNLMAAIKSGEPEEVVDYMALHQGEIDFLNTDILELDIPDVLYVQEAIVRGDPSILNALIQAGADINIQNRWKKAPLHLAAEASRLDLVKILLSSSKIGAAIDVNARNYRGLTPLNNAAEVGNIDMFKMLIEHGADIHTLDKDGESILHKLIVDSQLEIAQMLVNQGVQINEVSTFGNTPLMAASYFGATELVELYLQKGAQIDRVARNGYTVFHLSATQGHLKTLQTLISALPEDAFEKESVPKAWPAWVENTSLSLEGLDLSKIKKGQVLLKVLGLKNEMNETVYDCAKREGQNKVCDYLKGLMSVMIDRSALDQSTQSIMSQANAPVKRKNAL